MFGGAVPGLGRSRIEVVHRGQLCEVIAGQPVPHGEGGAHVGAVVVEELLFEDVGVVVGVGGDRVAVPDGGVVAGGVRTVAAERCGVSAHIVPGAGVTACVP